MINTRAILLIGLFLALWSGKASAQLRISHEIGILTGPAGFFTDYGERWNIRNNLENEGFGVGLVHYMNFAFKPECSCRPTKLFFTKHFRIRSEIDYMRSKLDHFGPVAQGGGESGRLLRAMHGSTQLFQGGLALEYHLFGIKEARDFAVLFAPYISLGLHYVYYDPHAYSDLGPLDSPKVLFPTFENGIFLDGGHTFAIVGSGGIRYRLGRYNDLLVEARAHYYDTDRLDGLEVQGAQNKFNDFVLWVSVGYVYYLNF
ncbi:MAG: glutamate dehydrogenase [Christiangramia sp.]|nr:glutamate dehydrogenase [Christiangramia sp.]